MPAVDPTAGTGAPGVFSPGRRMLTSGLVLIVTLVAFESLAIGTVMPLVEEDLGDLWLYGWVFSAFFLGNLVGIVVAGTAADRMRPAVPFAAGLVLFAAGLVVGGLAPSMLVLVMRSGPAGPRRRGDAGHLLRVHRPGLPARAAAHDVRPRLQRLGDPVDRRARRWPGWSGRPSAGGGCSSGCCRCAG